MGTRVTDEQFTRLDQLEVELKNNYSDKSFIVKALTDRDYGQALELISHWRNYGSNLQAREVKMMLDRGPDGVKQLQARVSAVVDRQKISDEWIELVQDIGMSKAARR